MIGLIFCFSLAFSFSGTDAAWHQVWEDQFNGNTLNETDWKYRTYCSGNYSWGNHELECYTSHRKENVRVENGHLVINVKVEPFYNKQFTSALLCSKHAWAYGKFEARAKMPKGRHLWPAIWMMPIKSVYGEWAASGEIDIIEYRGERTNQIQGNIHYGGTYPNNNSSRSGRLNFTTDFSADWHTFGIGWDVNGIAWFVDGKQFHKVKINRNLYSGRGPNPYTKPGQPFDQPFYWILNIAAGGDFFPAVEFGPEVTLAEARKWPKPTMEIDYVRVWEWK